jgi:tight adherence protein C
MTANTLLLPSIAFLVVFLALMVIGHFATKQETMRNRVQRMTNPKGGPTPKEDAIEDPLRLEHESSFFAGFCEQALRMMGVNTEQLRKDSAMRFYRSGIQSPDAPVYFLFIKRVMFVACVGLAIYVFMQPAAGTTKLMHYIVCLILLFLGVSGANVYLKNLRDKREKVLQRSFPDALDLLLVCVESGLALDGALSRVCKELGRAHPMIAYELNRTRLELTLLNDRAQALSNLAERTDMIAFRSLVTTLLQSERFGTSLTETLRVLSEEFRNTRLMLAEEKAGRLPVLMTIPLITLMMPALFLIILGPAILGVMKLMHSS